MIQNLVNRKVRCVNRQNPHCGMEGFVVDDPQRLRRNTLLQEDFYVRVFWLTNPQLPTRKIDTVLASHLEVV
jgi:hypothetical protein